MIITQGYLSSYTETDPVFTAWDKSTGISITESQISDLGTYLESVSISDINATGTADNTTYLRGDGVWSTVSSGSGGTVTSVALSAPTGLSVSGSPITTSGTLALSFTEGYSYQQLLTRTMGYSLWLGYPCSAGYLTSASSLDATKLNWNYSFS